MTKLVDRSTPKPRVGLFATCLVDAVRPQIGFAAVQLLEEAGCVVDAPYLQTCCGQPAYNEGDDESAKALASNIAEAFAEHDALVAPSGSCVGMIHKAVDLFEEGADRRRVAALAAKSWELTAFLCDARDWRPRGRRVEMRYAYHHSCSGLRQLGIERQPLALLDRIEGARSAGPTSSRCCGFGGAFCVKFPEIADRIAEDRIGWLDALDADTLLGGDLGCLLHLDAALARAGRKLRRLHVAEALAGAPGPAIGETGTR